MGAEEGESWWKDLVPRIQNLMDRDTAEEKQKDIAETLGLASSCWKSKLFRERTVVHDICIFIMMSK